MAFEVNFDGLVGPTHNYSGLSSGNLASTYNKETVSEPKKAALQGLLKMRALHRLGIQQGLLPPQERPFLPELRRQGLRGSDAEVISKAAKMPDLMRIVSSAASMWTANAGTVIPSRDSMDARVHLIPANLRQMPHRAIEAKVTQRILQRIFSDLTLFQVHPPLDTNEDFGDEGAANHTRFCEHYGHLGVHLFVYGKSQDAHEARPKVHPARQTKEAGQKISKDTIKNPYTVIFAQQNPKAIDAGAFHNDVVSVGNLNVFLYHEEAFLDRDLVARVDQILRHACGVDLLPICVKAKDIPLATAVTSYLFNSQLVTLTNGKMALIAPSTCEEMPTVKAEIDRILRDAKNPIEEVCFLNLHESMKNGGGPACLRLRVVLTENELRGMNQKVLLNDKSYEVLVSWVHKHYRDTLTPNDLTDPNLYLESCQALDELTQILDLGSVYDFQK